MSYIRKKPSGKIRARKGYFKYGYYWGPDWSGGYDIGSIDYKNKKRFPYAPTPIDWNDRSAAEHDRTYSKIIDKGYFWYGNPDLEKADYKFAWRGLRAGYNSGKFKYGIIPDAEKVKQTLRGVMGAAAVGGQGITRRIYRFFHPRQNKFYKRR